MENAFSYSGESVRRTFRRLYGGQPNEAVRLPLATVPAITPQLLSDNARVMDTILAVVRQQLASEQAEEQPTSTTTPTTATTTSSSSSTAITDNWLLSAPAALRGKEEVAVNYLGMLVAIDFCHWAEVLPPNAAARGDLTVEEGGITTAPGEEVTGFAGFYCVVSDAAPTVAAAAPSISTAQDVSLTEPKSASGGASGEVTLLRGSVAMMYLLRRAAEVHDIAWYDVDYLQQFGGDIDVALQALQVCFLGCEKDGVTPLWMPCTRQRVALLLSIAEAFAKQGTSYYQLLQQCQGYMFRPPESTAAAAAGVLGFVPSLVRLHPRYRDFVCEGGADASGATEPGSAPIPILKLSQLTALAMEQALPVLWRHFGPPPLQASAATASPSWLAARAGEVAGQTSANAAEGLFLDRTELSICCDYQIPKTLRAAGLIVYDAKLADLVDRHVLLRPSSPEEASIRIATLVAADRLLEFLNGSTSTAEHVAKPLLSSPCGSAVRCDVNHLDYALWYVGRYMVPSEARHHLCRTIMY